MSPGLWSTGFQGGVCPTPALQGHRLEEHGAISTSCLRLGQGVPSDPPQLSDAQTQGREELGGLEQRRPQHTGSVGRASTQTHRARGILKAFTVTPQTPGGPGLPPPPGPQPRQGLCSTDRPPTPARSLAPPTGSLRAPFPRQWGPGSQHTATPDAQWSWPAGGQPGPEGWPGSPTSDLSPGDRWRAALVPEVVSLPLLAATEANSLHCSGACC